MKKQLLVAQFATEKPSGESGRRKDFVFYSGAEIERYDFWNDEKYTIQFSLKSSDVRLGKLDGAPLLKDHRMSVDTTIGHIENPRIENGRAVGTAVFADSDDATAVWAKVDGGHIRDVSMGVVIDRLDMVSDNKKDKVKKYMAFGWEPYEISVVPDGADPAANFLMSQEDTDALPSDVREFLRDLYKRKEFLNELHEDRDALRGLTQRYIADQAAVALAAEQAQQDLASAGAASPADNAQRERTRATLMLRQRQYGYLLR